MVSMTTKAGKRYDEEVRKGTSNALETLRQRFENTPVQVVGLYNHLQFAPGGDPAANALKTKFDPDTLKRFQGIINELQQARGEAIGEAAEGISKIYAKYKLHQYGFKKEFDKTIEEARKTKDAVQDELKPFEEIRNKIQDASSFMSSTQRSSRGRRRYNISNRLGLLQSASEHMTEVKEKVADAEFASYISDMREAYKRLVKSEIITSVAGEASRFVARENFIAADSTLKGGVARWVSEHPSSLVTEPSREHPKKARDNNTNLDQQVSGRWANEARNFMKDLERSSAWAINLTEDDRNAINALYSGFDKDRTVRNGVKFWREATKVWITHMSDFSENEKRELLAHKAVQSDNIGLGDVRELSRKALAIFALNNVDRLRAANALSDSDVATLKHSWDKETYFGDDRKGSWWGTLHTRVRNAMRNIPVYAPQGATIQNTSATVVPLSPTEAIADETQEAQAQTAEQSTGEADQAKSAPLTPPEQKGKRKYQGSALHI